MVEQTLMQLGGRIINASFTAEETKATELPGFLTDDYLSACLAARSALPLDRGVEDTD